MKRPFLVQLRRPFIFLIVMIKAKANGQKGSFAKVWTGPVVQVKSSMMALVWRCCTELVAESKQQLKEELGRRLSFGWRSEIDTAVLRGGLL